MRSWKNWLAPILTGLTVAALALLPLRLSTLRDNALTGAVHTEALAEDSNFPAKPPELARRLQLLAQEAELPDTLTVIGQDLDGNALTESIALARQELAALADAGILPRELEPDNTELFAAKVYLRDQADLSSAGFINLGGYDRTSGEYRSLVLDTESGLLVALELDSVWILKNTPDAAELGTAFLDRLGLEYQPAGHSNTSLAASFRLQGAPVLYWATISHSTLRIGPLLDWETIDLSKSHSGFPDPATDATAAGQRR